MCGNNSVLIVSGTEKGINAIKSILPDDAFGTVLCESDAAKVRERITGESPDTVIINTPMPDGGGVRLAVEISRDFNTGVILLVKPEDYDRIEKRASGYGIFTLSKPTTSRFIVQATRLLAAARHKIAGFERREAGMKEKIEEMKVISRAKSVLMNRLNMNEQEAHRYIIKQAMDTRTEACDVARRILQTYDF